MIDQAQEIEAQPGDGKQHDAGSQMRGESLPGSGQTIRADAAVAAPPADQQRRQQQARE